MSRILRKLLRNRLTIPLTPFYRRYPYRGKVTIDSADARGAIDLELNFFYNRIPKAANSTIITTLANLRFNRDIPSREAKKLFLPPSMLNKQQVDRLDHLFRFSFVRNPYTRTLSAFLDKVERRAIRDNKYVSFRGFLEQLDRGKLYSNGHWAPQNAMLLLPVEKFDFVGKVETLQQDLSHIRYELAGVPRESTVKSVLSNATDANSKLEQYYDKHCMSLVLKLYQKDFDLFGYSDKLPFN